MWEAPFRNGRGLFTNSCAAGAARQNLLKSLMFSTTPAEITGLYRYPVKGLTPEPLGRVCLRTGQTFPADRRYAIENGPSGFDPVAPSWLPKSQFLMLMRNERLAGWRSRFEDDSHLLIIRKDDQMVARGDLDTAEGRAAIEGFFADNFVGELKGPPKLVSALDHSFSDLARKVVSIINLASVQAIERMVGRPVHPLRFRANLYLDGWPAWHEFDLLGQTLAIGPARLKVVKRTTRCAAVNVDPETAARDLDIPAALMRSLGHNECGIYAEVTEGGAIAIGDRIAAEAPTLP
jgi:MOSC domain-containing protein